mgnify:CR=1 FL=1
MSGVAAQAKVELVETPVALFAGEGAEGVPGLMGGTTVMEVD